MAENSDFKAQNLIFENIAYVKNGDNVLRNRLRHSYALRTDLLDAKRKQKKRMAGNMRKSVTDLQGRTHRHDNDMG